ncbi:efflux RND transporter periplasmic adaptor subunit [Stenotrophomonas sp.]|uniref:efflux RND transporter periplasmic adaptor subunit n=1 Tax=Stenotrophomonas sp. TaxID=69392 RepID=UPI002899AAB4|nr:efflux RND transporter periplasmic adaptor subunit [Stenotrophomonas sp.]
MRSGRIAAVALVAIALLAWGWTRYTRPPETAADPAPVMSVDLVQPQSQRWPLQVSATGAVAAWQEASIGSEANGLLLTEVRVNVGDTVRPGELLARFSPELMQAELAEASAAVALARAEAREAAANHQRAQALDGAGVMSRQQVSQYQAAALTSQARLQAAQAAEQKARLRVQQTQVRAPGAGVISARSATVGAVVPAGQELFRLIRDGRLEWRAVVSSADLQQLQVGQSAHIRLADGGTLQGTVRSIGPMIDGSSRSGQVYVDLPASAAVRAGDFVQGHILVGERSALTLPQTAILMRDGFHFVMQIGQGGFVTTRKVAVGRQREGRTEIVEGLDAADAVIASGLGFLNDADRVRVADASGLVGAAP